MATMVCRLAVSLVSAAIVLTTSCPPVLGAEEFEGLRTWVSLGLHHTGRAWVSASSNQNSAARAADRSLKTFWAPDSTTTTSGSNVEWIQVHFEGPTPIMQIDVHWHGQAPPASAFRIVAQSKERNGDDTDKRWADLPLEITSKDDSEHSSSRVTAVIRTDTHVLQKLRVECDEQCAIAGIVFNHNDLIESTMDTSKPLFGVAIPVAPRSPMYIDEV